MVLRRFSTGHFLTLTQAAQSLHHLPPHNPKFAPKLSGNAITESALTMRFTVIITQIALIDPMNDQVVVQVSGSYAFFVKLFILNNCFYY